MQVKHIGKTCLAAPVWRTKLPISMRRFPPLVATLFLFLCATVLRAASPASAETLAVMERAADWQLADPSAHKPTDWTQAAFYTGAMALAEVSPSPRFHDAMMKMAEGNEW